MKDIQGTSKTNEAGQYWITSTNLLTEVDLSSQTLSRQTTDFLINGSGVSSHAGDLGLGSPEVTSVETAALAASAQANAAKPPPMKQETKTGALNNSMSMNVNALANYDETLGEVVKEVTGLVRNETVAALKRMHASLLSIANPYCDAEVSGNALNELSDIVLDLATRSCLIGLKVGRDIDNKAWSHALI